MTKTIPIVQDGFVVDDYTPGPTIYLDTLAWFAWLEAPTTTRFSYALFNRAQGYIDGFMTVRKERRQRGTAYWTVYRRQGPRLRKIYVGPSTALTQAHLEHIAALLRPRAGPPPNPHFWATRQPSCRTHPTQDATADRQQNQQNSF
jgi:LuxR family transcriptional regulator, maltose regulon positive regulatory protein